MLHRTSQSSIHNSCVLAIIAILELQFNSGIKVSRQSWTKWIMEKLF